MSYSEQENEIKCKNFEICKTNITKLWYFCSGSQICNTCYKSWGELSITKNEKCSMCLKINKCVNMKNDEKCCINCFNKTWRQGENNEPFVEDWYPNIEDEFFIDPYNKKWIIKYPMISDYFKEFKQWSDVNRCSV